LKQISPIKQQLKRIFADPALTPEISNGIAGQGLVLIETLDILDDSEFVIGTLKKYVSILLDQQEADGSWKTENLVNNGY
ncbi:hypothetical protein KK062_30560, partial [Fulvivirgaceae bacterium PWU5]